MPRKKITVPIIFPDGPAATRRSRGRKAIASVRSETGDPKIDGEIWLSRIAMTRQARLMLKNGERSWRRYYRWYEGEQWDDRGGQGYVSSDNPRDTATINKTGSIINSIVPFLINDEIKFLLKPQRPDDGMSASTQQALLNYEWRKRKMTNAMKVCARDMIIIGHCIAKPGYTVEVDESKKPKDDGVINYADYVKQDAPYVERVNPLNFVFDWGGRDRTLRTARWCGEVFFVPYADVLANKDYDRETLGMLYSGEYSPTTQTNWASLGVDPKAMKGLQSFALPEDNLVTLIEIWDKKYQKRMVYADGCPHPLVSEDWPYSHLGPTFPYVMAKYIDAPNQPYGIGLPRWIEDQQVQLNRMATLEQDVARKSRPRYKASDGTQPEEVTKFKNGDDVVVGDFQPIPPADLSQMFQVIEANIQRAIEEMTGADALLQGRALPSRTTAGEVGTRARLTGLKLDQHVEDFEEFVEDVAAQILGHLKKFRTTADVIEVVGKEGAEWHEYTNEDIQAGVDVEVNYFAAPKTDPDLEKQQALEVFQLIVQSLSVLAQTGAPDTFDMPNVVRWVLGKFGEKEIGRFFRSSRTPMPPTEGGGMTPEIGGTFAPSPIGQTPGVGQPGEGGSVEDLMQSMRGFMQ